MKYKRKLRGQEFTIETVLKDKAPGDVMLRDFSTEDLIEWLNDFKAEFTKVYFSKQATEYFLHRLLKEKQYPEYHHHLNLIAELWYRGIIAGYEDSLT